MNRNDKMQVLMSIIGETLRKHEIIGIINMSNDVFNQYYKDELNDINSILITKK